MYILTFIVCSHVFNIRQFLKAGEVRVLVEITKQVNDTQNTTPRYQLCAELIHTPRFFLFLSLSNISFFVIRKIK